jgi:hypothetical protein
MNAHTPGPWNIDAEDSDLFGQDQARFWINAEGMHVAYVDGPRNQERTANASLISAAPDLFDAIYLARQYIARDRNGFYDGQKNLATGLIDDPDDATILAGYDDVLRMIDAAIAKATGGV